MHNFQNTVMLIVFALTVFFIMWRPKGINETIPTAIGAAIVLMVGIVPLTDVVTIANMISGAVITILSTIVMSIVLESIGFFRWVALHIVKRANGSGLLLYIYIIALCFLMTLFFNNDGSILITTPILIQMMNILNLKTYQKIPFLLSGAIIATAASAPIAVSNIANLIALKIVGLDINGYVKMMFVPSMIGIMTIALLWYWYFKKDIPRNISIIANHFSSHSNFFDRPHQELKNDSTVDWQLFKICISIVIITRGSFFLFSPLGIPIEWVAVIGAVLLAAIRMYKTREGISDIIKNTPWHIFIFAFGMYVLVYGLRNVGLTNFLVDLLEETVASDPFHASLTMGMLLTVMSNLFNNLPAVMIGTLTLIDMNIDLNTLQISYLAAVIGSDIGALLTPIGTLATLIWMFTIRKHGIPFTWSQYVKVTLLVVPIGLIVSLLCLYFWFEWLFL